MESIWEKTEKMPEFPALEENLQVDTLVIGGGIAGILCACALKGAGVDTVLVEANRLCSGVTGKTTAKLTFQHGLFADKLLRRFGPERAGRYLALQQEALDRYRALCAEIDCDYEEKPNFVYGLDRPERLEQEVQALEHLGVPASLCQTPELPFPTAGAVKVPNQAQFHPLKFLAAIAKHLRIYENTRVTELAPGRASTAKGTIRAERIVVATHFPFLNKHGSYFLKMYQQRSYVLGLEGGPNLPGMYVDAAEGGLSFRNAGDFLLLGGRGGRTGKKHGGWEALSRDAQRFYPQAKERLRWATQDCMTLDGLPYVGKYSASTSGLYVVTGFQKWGMTSAMAASLVLRDQLLGRESPWNGLLSPSRSMLRPQLAINAWEAVTNLLLPRTPRCPHLGCALRWNKQERTWDCPCHGSRFSDTGKLLDGPATGDLPHPKS